MLVHKGRMFVPDQKNIKKLILDEYHKILYAGHPRYQKLITALKKEYFWPDMKNEVAKYLAHCLECQQVKAEHQHPVGLLHPLPIPEWKWKLFPLTLLQDYISLKRRMTQ